MNPANGETNPPVSLLGNSLLVRANEGRTLNAFGHAVVILLDGKQTGEKFTAFLNITPPGGGPGPHYTTTKTNGSISSKAGLVFYSTVPGLICFRVIAFTPPVLKIRQISLPVCSSYRPFGI
jgi:hypothetical protein